ncbi:RNA polymerase sigma factor [Candidatus Filomicrobium marinum]|uniref:RNA polymerase sigma factor n=2 Tax=Filomicrobium TaxID=119044 RepID=A0A0D6JGF4_9HYPH|nr:MULTISPECIES: sigma-70 family RNA polymerase sigma factor [Filomicrobium]CFX51254.1 RNA polymerase sigma factor [Candidatus Filomicrobium marinum]CPR20146.1 RNA polymerase sigma factor [Candidatus Filomicrobium marinum]SDP10929.1 RNA polymerase sigma-70 factor, ECF subfamily [Filomicrobium insigne]
MTAAQQSEEMKRALVAAIPNLRAFAISLSGNADRADDLVQEALVKAWDKIDTFQEGTNLKAWLFTILRNAYFSEFRKRRREVADGDGEYSSKLSVQPAQHGHLDLNDLVSALEQLSEDQREAILLVAAEGFSYEEAAEISGCAVGTVKSRVNRARARLAEIMHIESAEDLALEYSGDVTIPISGTIAGRNG